MVMGGDTCSEGRWFESQLCILDGHFSCFKGSNPASYTGWTFFTYLFVVTL